MVIVLPPSVMPPFEAVGIAVARSGRSTLAEFGGKENSGRSVDWTIE